MDNFVDLAFRIGSMSHMTIFFVCGSVKSGTTWMQIMLDAHPAVSCRGEGHFVDLLVPAFQTAVNQYNQHIEWKNAQLIGGLGDYPRFTELELAYTIRTAILLLLSRQAGDKPVIAIGEKTPDNIGGLPFLDLVFPHAKFILLVRDGRDCAVSGWFHNRRLSSDWLAETYPTFDSYAVDTAAGWAREQEIAVKFSEQRPERCLFVRYEDMAADAAGALGRTLRFLGVDDDAAIVADCCGKADFATLTSGRSPGQEDTGSFFRKGIAGDWHNHFSAEANAAFVRQAGPWLKHFGYPS